jgi:hypothetical protein
MDGASRHFVNLAVERTTWKKCIRGWRASEFSNARLSQISYSVWCCWTTSRPECVGSSTKWRRHIHRRHSTNTSFCNLGTDGLDQRHCVWTFVRSISSIYQILHRDQIHSHTIRTYCHIVACLEANLYYKIWCHVVTMRNNSAACDCQDTVVPCYQFCCMIVSYIVTGSTFQSIKLW